MTELVYRTLDPLSLNPSDCELQARLRAPISEFENEVKAALSDIKALIKPRYAAARVKLNYTQDGVDFGFGEVKSKALLKNLDSADEAFVVACTLGAEADRLVLSTKTSPSRAFVLDACASALAEALIDACETEIGKGLTLRPRFSPGYADFPLSHQPYLLKFLDADRRLGIFVSESLLMTPRKSITAVIGISG